MEISTMPWQHCPTVIITLSISSQGCYVNEKPLKAANCEFMDWGLIRGIEGVLSMQIIYFRTSNYEVQRLTQAMSIFWWWPKMTDKEWNRLCDVFVVLKYYKGYAIWKQVWTGPRFRVVSTVVWRMNSVSYLLYCKKKNTLEEIIFNYPEAFHNDTIEAHRL